LRFQVAAEDSARVSGEKLEPWGVKEETDVQRKSVALDDGLDSFGERPSRTASPAVAVDLKDSIVGGHS
jgi:hypothetical protein